MIQITLAQGFRSLTLTSHPQENLSNAEFYRLFMKTAYGIRQLVEKALHIKKLTPDIEDEINYRLTELGYISDVDYEALELLMAEMDAGRIQLVPSP